MRVLAIVLALAACGDSGDPSLPGDSPGAGDLIRRDDNSPCTGTVDHGADGEIDMLYQFIYDDLGRSVRDFGRSLTHQGDEVTEYTWDHVDHLTGLVQAIDDIEVTRMESTYDTLGNLLETTTTFAYLPDEVEVEVVTNHDFDAHGRPAYSIRSYTGLRDVKTTYVYDETGRTIERTEDSGIDGTIDGTTYVVYDEAARITTTTTAWTDGAHSLRTTTYNERLHMVSARNERWAADGTLRTNEMRMAWDGDRQVELSIFFDEQMQTIYEYSYACARYVSD